MAKFLDKKQQVIDFKLTSYGRHLLGQGEFRPTFYSFFDDNIVYDLSYTASGSSIVVENQNDIVKRIKQETPYIEGLTLFEEIDSLPADMSALVVTEDDPSTSTNEYSVKFKADYTPINEQPRQDIFRLEHMIGDAVLDADIQNIPAWKMVALSGQISSSFEKALSGSNGFKKDLYIPQINMDLNYTLRIKNHDSIDLLSDQDLLNPFSVETTDYFNDGNFITLETDDLAIYLEELNTMLMNENFDVEIFEITGSAEIPDSKLLRKKYDKNYKNLKGAPITEEYLNNYDKIVSNHTPSNVEYYFDIYKDANIDQYTACKGMETFNKNSYYIDIDFDCSSMNTFENVYNDIYGPVTEPELCQ